MLYKLSQNGKSGQKGEVHLGPNVSSSAHDCGCWSMVVVLYSSSNMSIIINRWHAGEGYSSCLYYCTMLWLYSNTIACVITD